MDVGDVLAHHFILPRQLIDLKFQFPLASLHTEEQSIGNGLLHTVKVGLERRINQIDIPVSCTSNFFFVEIFYLHAFLFGFLHLLPLRLFGGDTGGHNPLHVGFTLLEPYSPAGFEESPLPISLTATILLMQQVIIPIRGKVPWTVLHRLPLLFLLVVVGRMLSQSREREI